MKLEQVLIEFCNDPTLSQLDMGGLMSGTVIRTNQQDLSLSPLDAVSSAPHSTGGTYPGGFTNVLKPAATPPPSNLGVNVKTMFPPSSTLTLFS